MKIEKHLRLQSGTKEINNSAFKAEIKDTKRQRALALKLKVMAKAVESEILTVSAINGGVNNL